jgi:hypothetical protein
MTARSDQIGKASKPKFDNTNRGALFNDAENKAKDEDRDYAGTLNVDGREFWLSGWVKVSKKGTKYLSLSVKPKDAAAAKPNIDDEIAF